MKTAPAKKAPPKNSLRLIQAKVPPSLFAAVDQAVRDQDTDRSKFVRKAIRHALQLQGINA